MGGSEGGDESTTFMNRDALQAPGDQSNAAETGVKMAHPMGRRGIVILGKARGRCKESLQLMGRSGLAGLLWHLHPEPKPLILIVSRDAPEISPDALRVARFLSEEMQIPSPSVLARTCAGFDQSAAPSALSMF